MKKINKLQLILTTLTLILIVILIIKIISIVSGESEANEIQDYTCNESIDINHQELQEIHEPFDREWNREPNPIPQCEYVEYDAGTVEQLHDWNYFKVEKQVNSTYMGIHKITDRTSPQWQWLNSHEWDYDAEGICEYQGRILVALTPIFGDIGDKVDLLFQDGSTLEVIIADYKGTDAKHKYGHIENGYVNVIELLVSKDWYSSNHENVKYGKVIAYENITEKENMYE